MRGRISSLARSLGHFREGNLWHYKDLLNAADVADLQSIPPGWEENAWEDSVDEPQEPVVEAIFSNMYPVAWDVPEARAYLEGRGIGQRAASTLGLRYKQKNRRVLFPVRGMEGQFYGYTGRAIYPNPKIKILDDEGLKKRQHVLGADRWRPGKVPLIVVEGLFAFAHLVNMGVEKVADVGALLGSELTDWKRDLILKHGHSVYLLLDNDPGGDACLFGRPDPNTGDRMPGTGMIESLCREIPVMVPAWPEGKLDPDELNKQEVWDMLRHTPVWGTVPVPPAWR
jgi:hypothetical protein